MNLPGGKREARSWSAAGQDRQGLGGVEEGNSVGTLGRRSWGQYGAFHLCSHLLVNDPMCMTSSGIYISGLDHMDHISNSLSNSQKHYPPPPHRAHSVPPSAALAAILQTAGKRKIRSGRPPRQSSVFACEVGSAAREGVPVWAEMVLGVSS